jgi:hypothetical protein
MSDTKWKNMGGKMGGKEGFTDKPNKNSSPPLQFPTNYPVSESSTTSDTINRIKKIKKKRSENPKKIPILENIYESEDGGSESVFSSPENIFTSFFESPQSVKEGLTLPRNLKSKSPGSDESAYDKVNASIEKRAANLKANLTDSQKAYSDKMTETRAQIDKLKHNIFNIDKMSTDFSEDINAKPPPSSPADQNIMKQGSQDAEKEASEALKRVGYVIKLMIDKLIKWTNLGIAKFKLQMYKFVLKYKEIVTSIAQALTGYSIQPDGTKKYYATETEIKTFSHEIVRFLTILMSWIFLYNWYYLMFFLKPQQQFKLNLNNWYEKHSMIYAALGPPLRAVENIDWFILEFLPRIRYLIPSTGILFFIMSIVFIVLVQKGKQWTIMNDFFNAVNKSYTTSILSAFVIGCIVVYGLSFAGYFASMFNFALLQTWYTALLWIIFTVIYLLCIITLGVPIGMLAVCGFFFFYSFFAIIMYNGFSIGPVLKAVSEQITNISSVNFNTSNMTWAQWAYTTLQKFVKYFLYFMFELFILYILINGLVNYTKGYNVPLAEKATLQNAFSTTGAFKEAFHHLYTWLIIVNVLLIVLIFVIMKIRYDSIKNLPPNQPFNDDTGETMFQRLMNVGSITKNAVMGQYNKAAGIKNAISQNTGAGKARIPLSGKTAGIGAVGLIGNGGVPGIGNMINAAGSLDSKTLGTITSSAMSAASVAAKDPNLRKAGISMLKGEGLDVDALAKADTKNLQSVLDSGLKAVDAVADDPNAGKAAAGILGTNTVALGKLASAVTPALGSIDKEAIAGQIMMANLKRQ